MFLGSDSGYAEWKTWSSPDDLLDHPGYGKILLLEKLLYSSECNMTLEEEALENSQFTLVDYSVPQRDKAIIHPAVDPPLCQACTKMELSFFDPGCPGCEAILTAPATNIPQLFAILRQWTPQTQQNLEAIVKEILKRGAHVNDRDGLTDMTMLHYASKAGANGVGDVEAASTVLNLLIVKGSDVYIRCRWTNMTSLHYASYFDVAPAIRILLKATKGLDIESPCSEFDHGTSLHIAASNLAFDAAKCLLQNGADPRAKDDLGRTPVECVPDPNAFDPTSEMGKLVSQMKKMLSEAEPVSQKDMLPMYDNIQGKVTLQSLGLKIGDKVMVGGVKSGFLRYCGPTEFATGIWAGIELDEAAGKNDGGVGGISYFKCSPKYGIFAPIGKISRPGILKSGHNTPTSRTNSSILYGKMDMSHNKIDTSRVTAKVDTGLKVKTPRKHSLSSMDGGSDIGDFAIGDRVLVAGQRKGVVRFCGPTKFAPGVWYGVELERPFGKNDGSVNGERYFTCKPKFGIFAPPSRIQKTMANRFGSTDSVHSSHSYAEKERRLSDVSGLGSQHSLHSAPAVRQKTPRPSKRMSLVSSTPAPGEFKLAVGMSVFCNNELGVIRYIGPTDFAEGVWLGIELRTAKGKNDGTVQGKRYFSCKANYGLIVRPSKVTVRGINGAKLIGEYTS